MAQYNLLEALCAQVPMKKTELWRTLGKLLKIVNPEMKKFVKQHAPPNAREINILIISDAKFDKLAIAFDRSKNPVFDSITRNKLAGHKPFTPSGDQSTGLIKNIHSKVLDHQCRQRKSAPISSKNALKKKFREQIFETMESFLHSDVEGSPGNINPRIFQQSARVDDEDTFDLAALYHHMGPTENETPKWNIERTVYSLDGSSTERTVFGIRRESTFFNSAKPVPSTMLNKYDLILMRRGVCYCEVIPGKACCGVGPHQDMDLKFLKKVRSMLKNNQKSGAYLGGYNTPGDSAKWTAALQKLPGTTPRHLVDITSTEDGDYSTCGIFLSRGKKFNTHILTT